MTVADSMRPEASADWSAMDAAQVEAALQSSASTGLSNAEARRRFVQGGPNELVLPDSHGPLRILLAQFTDVMVLLLIGAAAVAGLLGETRDFLAITTIVLLNAALGFAQEYRAERAMAALSAMAAPSARVRREATELAVPSREIVVGDIVLLEAGNVVPADLRLVEAHRARIEEAALTGESQPVDKTIEPIAAHGLAIGDRRNMAYKGTVVSYGRVVGVAVATGMATELGRIAALLDDDDERGTPLQRRLARFGHKLALVVVVLCGVIFLAGLLRGEPALLMFMTALSLAVAAVPEALPAVVTVSLGLGARKMARQRALIRRLPAVETLGSVTYICSDKTGTLTENRMAVEVVQVGNDPPGPLGDAPRTGVLSELIRAISLSNDAARQDDGELTGDPTEVALHRAASDAGSNKDELEVDWPRVAEVPFSSERARMTTVHRVGPEFVAYTKGAPERVLASCVDRAHAEGRMPLERDLVLRDAEAMAASGLRVLAVAVRRFMELPSPLDAVEAEQTFLGLVGLLDPPRQEARAAVATCQTAGIHVVMITGDHPATARAVAERLGIVANGGDVMTGVRLGAMSDAELEERIADTRVYARVGPEDKIRIVKALQHRGESVAMTGDGVNDAPALRRADIGVAMGRSGTDVAREAAHMILLDDNFATIVKAVREGRRIYDNIRRFVRYELSTNSGELWTLSLAPFFGLPLPLLPIHILWMNLVTDGLPGLALAAEPAERGVMERPPRPPDESIFAHGLWQHSVWVGLLMAGLALGTQFSTIHLGDAHWQSMTFTVLTFSQLAHVLAIRSEHESLFSQGVASNLPLLWAVIGTIALQMAVLYVPALASVFRTKPLTLPELAVCLGISSVVFFAVELEKWLIRLGVLDRARWQRRE